jgi:hypothetical protein
LRAEGECTAVAAGDFGVEAKDQAVEGGVVAGGGGGVVDVVESVVGYGSAGGGEPSGLGHLSGGVVGFGDEVVVLCVFVEAA